ncbi:MAG: hypothetical protein OXC95_00615 [Dehalococcoidia bacterium]|nr:hypothetical protein [Dehalococcoidia bacterium]
MTFWDDVYELREKGEICRVWKSSELMPLLESKHKISGIRSNPSNYSVTRSGYLDGGFNVKDRYDPWVWRHPGKPLKYELIRDPGDDAATQDREVKLSLERADALRSLAASGSQTHGSGRLSTHSSRVQSVDPDQNSHPLRGLSYLKEDSDILLDAPRWGIAHEFARWCARSALNSGKDHIKSAEDVYAALDFVDFQYLFDSERGTIDQHEFNDWHRTSVDRLIMKYEPRLNVGWAAKMIAIYLKTTCYIAGFGRNHLAVVIHPPIDNNLIKNLRKQFRSSPDIIQGLRSFRKISDMSIADYDNIIRACELIAQRERCTLFEVEQYFRPR